MKIKRSVLLSLLVQVTLRWMYKYAKEKIPQKIQNTKNQKNENKMLSFVILDSHT